MSRVGMWCRVGLTRWCRLAASPGAPGVPFIFALRLSSIVDRGCDEGTFVKETIDVHAHFIPPGLANFAERAGDSRFPVLVRGDAPEIVQHGRRYRAVDRGYFDVDVRVTQLDALDIAVQVLSPLPVMLPDFAHGSARDYCAEYNEGLVAVRDAHPDRFRVFGMIPMQDPIAAVREVERTRALGVDGFEFGTSIGEGVELADPAMIDVFAAVADANLPVLLHPNHDDTFGCGSQTIELGVGVGCETARAMALLHVAGTFDQCTSLRLCLSHGGGAFLWLWPRFAAIAARGGASPTLSDCLHVDTAGIVRDNFEYITKTFSADRILFGSDMPATTPERVAPLIAMLDTYEDVLLGNARRFLDG